MRYLILFVALMSAVTVQADTIELKTGERIEGSFKQATSSSTVIEVAGQAVTIPTEKIKAIYFGVATPGPSSGHQDALDAITALRSVTQSGIAYRDYSTRVLDAKVKVDKYLASSTVGLSAALRGAIGLAMREYELASRAWSGVLDRHNENIPVADLVGTTLIVDPDISKCPNIKELIDEGSKSAYIYRAYEPGARINDRGEVTNSGPWPHAHAIAVGLQAGKHPANLWVCAAEQVTKAEQLP